MNQTTVIQNFVKFPSTGQFRNTVQAVKHQARFNGLDANGEPTYNNNPLPTLMFRGTVKLHGTNAAVVFRPEGIHFQSRERILTLEEDNAGFCAYMTGQEVELKCLQRKILDAFSLDPDTAVIALFGEWCGGNIQKGVALNGLPKMFVFFLLNINGYWFEVDCIQSKSYANIYSILDFKTWHKAIDFSNPEFSQNELADLTNQVETNCPVGKEFGVDGIGEGIVWRCITKAAPEYWFKVKGEKHSASKVKTLASVDIEQVKEVYAFVEKTVTENRLVQAMAYLKDELRKPVDQTSTGDFIRWVVGDIHKEEADTLQASGLNPKDVNAKISAAAKAWYFKELMKPVA